MAVGEHQYEDIGAERDRFVGVDVAQGGGCQVIGIEAPGGVDSGICEAGDSMIYICLGRAWILAEEGGALLGVNWRGDEKSCKCDDCRPLQ